MNGNRLPGNTFISVAMATYNGAAFIREQLDSILFQTFTNFEIIIVDDFSTDSTRDILNDYHEKDARVKAFFNEENIGYRETFYKAILHCEGEYICFCDQDDIWVKNKLELLLDDIKDNLLIFSDSELIDEAGNRIGVKLSDTVHMRQPGTTAINRGFVIGNCVWGHTIMFHKDLLQYTAIEKNEHPHDWWLAVISSQLGKIKYCAAVLNYYRQHANNVTRAIPVKTGKVAGRKIAEFETQLSRIESIAALPFNKDEKFYLQLQDLFLKRKKGFSFGLFYFLLRYRQDVFSLKRKNVLAQLVEIRKMCRGVD